MLDLKSLEERRVAAYSLLLSGVDLVCLFLPCNLMAWIDLGCRSYAYFQRVVLD